MYNKWARRCVDFGDGGVLTGSDALNGDIDMLLSMLPDYTLQSAAAEWIKNEFDIILTITKQLGERRKIETKEECHGEVDLFRQLLKENANYFPLRAIKVEKTHPCLSTACVTWMNSKFEQWDAICRGYDMDPYEHPSGYFETLPMDIKPLEWFTVSSRLSFTYQTLNTLQDWLTEYIDDYSCHRDSQHMLAQITTPDKQLIESAIINIPRADTTMSCQRSVWEWRTQFNPKHWCQTETCGDLLDSIFLLWSDLCNKNADDDDTADGGPRSAKLSNSSVPILRTAAFGRALENEIPEESVKGQIRGWVPQEVVSRKQYFALLPQHFCGYEACVDARDEFEALTYKYASFVQMREAFQLIPAPCISQECIDWSVRVLARWETHCASRNFKNMDTRQLYNDLERIKY